MGSGFKGFPTSCTRNHPELPGMAQNYPVLPGIALLLGFFEGFNNIDSHTTTLTTNHITTYFFYPNSVTPRVQTLVTTMPSYTTLYTM